MGTDQRIMILGNAGGGKSTLARGLARQTGLPLIEYDTLMFTKDWTMRSREELAKEHPALIAKPRWIIEGMGYKGVLRPRMARATDIIHIDLPVWQHYAMIAERQIAWETGKLEHPPGANPKPYSIKDTFHLVHAIDKEWMPEIRRWIDEARAWANVTIYRDMSELPKPTDTGNLG